MIVFNYDLYHEAYVMSTSFIVSSISNSDCDIPHTYLSAHFAVISHLLRSIVAAHASSILR